MAVEELPAGDFYSREWRRIGCDGIAAEESELRRLHATQPDYIAALDRNPEHFRLGALWMVSYEGGGSLLVRSDLSGTDVLGRNPFRVIIDTAALGGRATTIRATINGHSAGQVTLDNRRFPDIDLYSTLAWMARRGPPLSVEFRYGPPREYCFGNDDARARVTVSMWGDGRVEASQRTFVNCSGESTDVVTGLMPAPR